ncbi:hypothetical protein HK097_000535 [Rhizophlyctis rosea]|uniref:Letm1 RBD domain-containing protein n=1 Tax=Rhizophlyctis rosea TaxID=64517 RepID=A0AAD5S8C6_9FUNG|nr:hypothetical protein HK097_000535 [Rhizophlyctis rosea]
MATRTSLRLLRTEAAAVRCVRVLSNRPVLLSRGAATQAQSNASKTSSQSQPEYVPARALATGFFRENYIQPAQTLLAGLRLISRAVIHSLNLWQEEKQNIREHNRKDIQHIIRTKHDLARFLQTVFFLVNPWIWPWLNAVLLRYPKWMPSVFVTDDILEQKLAIIAARREKLRPEIVEALRKDVDAALKADQSLPIKYMAMRWNQLLAKQEKTPTDITSLFDLFHHHTNIATAPTAEVKLWARYLGMSFPSVLTRSRLIRRLDLMLRDDALIRRDGVNSLTHYELVEALDERGYYNIIKLDIRQLRALLSSHVRFTQSVSELAVRKSATATGGFKAAETPAAFKANTSAALDPLGVCTVGAMIPVVRAVAPLR